MLHPMRLTDMTINTGDVKRPFEVAVHTGGGVEKKDREMALCGNGEHHRVVHFSNRSP